ncbi:MAG: hypothetical protein FWE09_06255, partial [Treponema sp.]|nr:hypothetical protein [Treponema sp.]
MNKPTRFLPVLFACALLLPSCATRITGSLQAEGRADFNVFAALEPRMAALLTGFALAGGAAPGAPILDGPSIALSMAGAPGVSSAAFANASPVSIEGRVQSSDIGEFLSGAAGAEAYGSFERFAGGGGRFSLGLDRASGRQMLALI